MIYYDTVIREMKLSRLEPAIIMMDFHTSNSYSHKNLFHYFKDYLITKLTLG
jgi:hypothetical protein